jgi:hypothetical protein
MTEEQKRVAFEHAMNAALRLAEIGSRPDDVKAGSDAVIDAAISAAAKLKEQATE